MNVSLLVTNFGKADLFKISLQKIMPQLTPQDEIVIVDDGPLDDMPIVAMGIRKKCQIRYSKTTNSEYRSGCRAKNKALKLASNELIIIHDPEVYQISNCINYIRSHFDKEENRNDFINAATMYFSKRNQSVDLPLDHYGLIPHSMAPFIAGVRKKNLLNIGGWDERFKYWGNDDNDLMGRLGRDGVVHKAIDEMVALHQWHPRPPQEMHGDANESLLYEKDKPIVANEGKEWGNG